MTDTSPENDQRGPRPLTAILLTNSSGLNAMMLLFAFYVSSFSPIIGALAGLSALITWGLWNGKNAAWALVIIASVIRLRSLEPIDLVLSGATLVIALLPQTRAYYRPAAGQRSQLSAAPKGILKVLGILFVGFIAIIVLAGFFA